MALLEETSQVQAIPVDKSKVMKLWKIAGILLVVTIIEFAFAFSLVFFQRTMRVGVPLSCSQCQTWLFSLPTCLMVPSHTLVGLLALPTDGYFSLPKKNLLDGSREVV